ncbi:MAG: transglutaminase-like domain-containing protein [Candidatus Cloacimonetes bacterium]|nr:transglutaminase-like domain-containing protein [Candidatus Cloacimonadota bacterium]
MRHITLIFLLLIATTLAALTLDERIERYAGDNASGLLELLDSQSGDTLRYVRFLLDNASSYDLSALPADFVLDNIRLAVAARQLPWAQDVPEQAFVHFVLPSRVSQEPYQRWRQPFYEELSAELEDITDIYEAITLVNIWCDGKMRFEPTSGRDQPPLTTIRRGYGRCEEMMILFIAAARSVGIPARTASAPNWSFTDNNHAWTEVWTPDGWTFLGSAEPANRLASAWFTRSTQRAPIITSHAIGEYDSPRTIETHLCVTTMVTTEIYAPVHLHRFIVLDEAGELVAEAEVTLFAVSWGGLFGMLRLDTDEDGCVEIPLGRADVIWSAQEGERFAMGSADGSKPGTHTLTITDDVELDDTFILHFLSKDDTELPESDVAILEDFTLRKRVAELTRDKWLRDQRQTLDFLRHFPLSPDDDESDEDYMERREAWLEMCKRLAGAADDWLNVLAAAADDEAVYDVLHLMLADWDIKELIEMPDSAAIHQRATLLAQARQYWAMPDSIWREHVLGCTFRRVPCPENGWALPFSERVAHLRGDDIPSTIAAVEQWLDAETSVDTTLRYTYFTGSPDPMQWLNMRNISKSGRRVLLTSALKSLGVPLRWRGFLEYWNDGEWTAFEEDEEDPVERIERTLTVRLEVDGTPTPPDPFGNMFLATIDEDGLYYTWFEAETDSLTAVFTWSQEPDVHYVLEAVTRNDNGDACAHLRSLDETTDSLVVRLWTPARRGGDEPLELDDKALAARDLGGAPQGMKLVYVLGREDTEPQHRMLEQLHGLLPDMTAAGVDVVVWVEGRRPIEVKDARVLYGQPVGGEELDSEAYPLVYLFDGEDSLLYYSRGYNLSVPGQIRLKVQ